MNIKVTGIDEMKNKLDELSTKVQAVSGAHSYSLADLLNDELMKKNTSFNTVDSFFKQGGFDVSSNEAFKAIDDAGLDAWVKKETNFENWKEMLQTASEEYIKNQIKI